jgi:hypothetical protein
MPDDSVNDVKLDTLDVHEPIKTLAELLVQLTDRQIGLKRELQPKEVKDACNTTWRTR